MTTWELMETNLEHWDSSGNEEPYREGPQVDCKRHFNKSKC